MTTLSIDNKDFSLRVIEKLSGDIASRNSIIWQAYDLLSSLVSQLEDVSGVNSAYCVPSFMNHMIVVINAIGDTE